MSRTSRSREIAAYALLQVFKNDATIDAREMATLKKLALEDGEIDEDERAVLQNIFRRISREQVTPEVWQQICDLRSRFGLG